MKKKTPAPPLKLNLGCGQNKRDGFTGVDIVKTKATDVVHDLLKFPWPFKDASVEEIFCSHFFEHVPGLLRGRFMDEAYRVLVDGGKMLVICPYWSSPRAIQDFTHQWPPVAEHSFLYFNAGWRKTNGLDHYPVHCDFDFSFGYSPEKDTTTRPEETRSFWIKHYLQAVNDVHVTLTKRKPDDGKNK